MGKQLQTPHLSTAGNLGHQFLTTGSLKVVVLVVTMVTARFM